MPPVELETIAFEMEQCLSCGCDYLTVNGVKYCGTSGPQGVVPEDGVIEWTSDDGVVRSGWKARTDGSLSPRLLALITHLSNPFRSAGRHGRQPSQGVDLPSPGAGVGMNQCDMGKDATGFVNHPASACTTWGTVLPCVSVRIHPSDLLLGCEHVVLSQRPWAGLGCGTGWECAGRCRLGAGSAGAGKDAISWNTRVVPAV